MLLGMPNVFTPGVYFPPDLIRYNQHRVQWFLIGLFGVSSQALDKLSYPGYADKLEAESRQLHRCVGDIG